MSNRKKQTYLAVYRYIHSQLLELECNAFMADYEIAMTDAFLEIVPNAKPTHCHFHFTQANKRNARKCTAMMNVINRYHFYLIIMVDDFQHKYTISLL